MPLCRLHKALLLTIVVAASCTRPVLAQTPTASLARYAPQQDLFMLFEFDGLDAHNAAWTRTSAYQLLNKTTLGALLEDLAKQGLNRLLASMPSTNKPTTTELIDGVKRLLRGGFLVAVSGKPGQPQMNFVVAIRGGARNGLRPLIERIIAPPDAKTPGLKTEDRLGRSIVSVGTESNRIAWWSERDDLVISSAPAGIQTTLAVIDGGQPNATTHPIRIALAKPEPGFTQALRMFIDMSAIPIPAEQAQASGLKGLKRIDYRWGFQDSALYSVGRLVAPAPRTGLLALLDGASFEKSKLPPLPPEMHGFTVLALEPGQVFSKFTTVVKTLDPKAGRDLDQFLNTFPERFGFDIKREFLDQLGPKMTFGAKPTTPRAPLDAFFTAQVKTSATMIKVLDRLTPIANAMLNPPRPGAPGQPNRAGAGGPQMRKVTSGIGAGSTWIVDLPAGMLPPNLSGLGLRPTIRVGKSTLVIASRPELAQSLIPLIEGNGKKWAFAGDYATMAKSIPGNLVMLSVDDPRDTFPSLIENLPALFLGINAAMAANGGRGGPPPITVNTSLVPRATALAQLMAPSFSAVSTNPEGISLVSRESIPSIASPATAGVAIALLLPAVQSAREAARRAQCMNNLRQMGLALHNYASTSNDGFPAASITSKDGKPLLSWRVAILPFIEQQQLYDRFHLDEPWDSPHNKALIPLIPATFTCPSNPGMPGHTHYLGFVGNGALWEQTKPTKISQITDGTSFTLLVTESAIGVPWTKPEDIYFNPNSTTKLLGAGSTHPGGFNAMMADGSVRFISERINPTTLKSLITKNLGEVIGPGGF